MKKLFITSLFLFLATFFCGAQNETQIHFDLVQDGTYQLDSSQKNVKVFHNMSDYFDYYYSLIGNFPVHLVNHDMNFKYFQLVHINPGSVTNPHKIQSVIETDSNIIIRIIPLPKARDGEITPGFRYYILSIKRSNKPIEVEIST